MAGEIKNSLIKDLTLLRFRVIYSQSPLQNFNLANRGKEKSLMPTQMPIFTQYLFYWKDNMIYDFFYRKSFQS